MAMTGQEAARRAGEAGGPGRLMCHVTPHGGPARAAGPQHSADLPCSDSSFSSDFTNKQMRQKLLIVKKYRWLPVWLFVSPHSHLLRWTDTAPWGQRGSHRAPTRPSCRCVLRLLPAGWPREGDLRNKLVPPACEVSTAKARPLLPPGGETGITGAYEPDASG